MTVTLTNAQVVYAVNKVVEDYSGDSTVDAVVLKDATATVMIEGLAQRVEAGQVLNGALTINVEVADLSAYGMGVIRSFSVADASALNVAEGVAPEPTVLTEDNVDEWAEAPEWQYITLTDAVVSVVAGDYGDEPALTVALGKDIELGPFSIMDLFRNLDEEFAEGDVVTATGFVATIYGSQVFVPVTVVKAAAGEVYTGVIEQTLSHPQAGVMGTTTSDQTVTIAANEDGTVNITFSGFTFPVMGSVIPEFTIENVAATANEDGTVSYAATDFTVSTTMGQMNVYYAGTLEGIKASEDATPVLHLTLKQATTDEVYFGADQAAIDAYKLATGIQTVENGMENATIYDLSGRKVEKVQRGGVYIVNGKKVSVK